jgi:methionine synthase II (cobalamin-independent)
VLRRTARPRRVSGRGECAKWGPLGWDVDRYSGLRTSRSSRGGTSSLSTVAWRAKEKAWRSVSTSVGTYLSQLSLLARTDDESRGNFRSRHFSSGGYEPVAEVLLKELNVDVYLLEYDDARWLSPPFHPIRTYSTTYRSGGFEPLRHLPKGNKVVTLGLVSSKTGVLEKKEDIIARIREAATFCPLEQLNVGPQCGFASTVHGNELTNEEQWAKIKLCQEIVEEVWGKQ